LRARNESRTPTAGDIACPRGHPPAALLWVVGGVVAVVAGVYGLSWFREAQFERDLRRASAVLLGKEEGDRVEAAHVLDGMVFSTAARHDIVHVSVEFSTVGRRRHAHRAERSGRSLGVPPGIGRARVADGRGVLVHPS
jgi:hypothetical protein